MDTLTPGWRVNSMDYSKEELVAEVLRLIVEDVEYGDLSSIEGLLMRVPESTLIVFLPED